MSYFDDASLVMIPSGYKASKVYSVKPTDGTGDLTFTRSNATATRVGPDGLIEKVRTNVALYSEDLTNAYWTKIFATISGNSIANPLNGAVTADTITPTTDNDVHRARISATGLTAGQTYTYSFYAKANGYNFVRVIENTTTGDVKQFNLSNGTIDLGILTGQIVSLGNGWYRCAVQIPVVGTSQTIDVQVQQSSAVQSFIGNGTSGVYFFGAQLELSDFGATPYIATTTAAVSVGPVANVPRLDYLNSTCPRLLLEPQRTNLAFFSEQFNNAYWTKTGGTTITANTTISPDGYTNADTIAFAGSGDSINLFVSSGLSVVNGTTYTMSVFTKSTTQVVFFGGATGGSGTNVFNGSVDYGNGWYRQSITRTWSASGTASVQLVMTLNAAGSSIAYGCQAELGAYATSYIPTLGAAVTRGADACSKTGISSLIGQTEGVIFGEMYTNTSGNESLLTWLRNGTAGLYGNFIFLGTNGSAQPRVQVVQSGSQQAEIIGSALAVGWHKFAFAYKLNDFALYVDGVQIGTASSGTIPTGMNELFIDQYIDGGIRNASKNQALLFKTRLTNAQLAELTTI